VPYLVLLAEVLLFFRLVLFGDGYAIPWDHRSFHLPMATFIADSLRRGEFPLWDPYTYCGRAFFANIQTQVFYPPAILAILISNWFGPQTLLTALNWQLVLHVFLAGVFTYCLLLRLGLSRWAALAGASVYQLGGFFASQAQHLVVVNSGAWLPLAWLAVIELHHRITWRWAGVLAFALAMSILAGFPAVAVVVVLSSLLLAIGLGRAKTVAAVMAASAWAGLLAAIQLLPTLQLHGLSIAKYRTDWLAAGGGLPLASLISLAYPNYYGIFDLKTYKGPWEPTYLYLYCSLAGLLLALAAALIRRTRVSNLFTALTVISAFCMLGASTPVGRVTYRMLPAAIRNGLHPEFAMPAFVLGVAVLAGFGVHRFFQRPLPGYTITAVIVLDLILTGSGRPMNAIAIEQDPAVTSEAFGGSRELLQGVRRLSALDMPPARIDTRNGGMPWAMSAPVTRVPSANGNDPLALERIIQARLAFCKGERWGRYYEVGSLDSPVLDLMNVRWLLSNGPIEHPRWRKFADLPGTEVYENTTVLPRFFLVSGRRRVAGMNEAAAALRDPAFDPRRVAIVESGEAGVGGTGTVRTLRYEPNRLELEVEAAGAAFLVTSEAYYPGWRAWIDDQPRPLVMTNAAFRGLAVPAGRHTVRMEFAPSILWQGALFSALGWLLLAASSPIRFLWRRRRQAKSTAPA
jgi:hypothetical protein